MIQGIYPNPADPGPIGQNPQVMKKMPNANTVTSVATSSSVAPSSVATTTTTTTSSKATPISMLQELCQKLNKTPRYDLLTMEGRAHQPSFVFRCTVGDVTGEGHGTSKKSSKHQAAENVLNQLKSGIVPGEEKKMPKEEIPEDQSLIHGGEINPVGTLQELVVSRGWRLPDYSLASEAGPAHKKEFIICCSVEKLKEYGSGSSKKVAKRNAASAMLTRLREIPSDSKEHVVDNDDLDSSFTGRGPRGYVPLEMLRNANGERIVLGKLCDSAEPIMQLHEYSIKHGFTTDFLDIVERSTCGLFQCLLRLNTMPTSVVHGQGATAQDSHVEAARNALQYLNIMATEKGLQN